MAPMEVVHRLRGGNGGALVGRGCCQSPSEFDRGREGKFDTSVLRLACLDFLDDEEEENTLNIEEEEGPCPASDALPLTPLATLLIGGGSGESDFAEYGCGYCCGLDECRGECPGDGGGLAELLGGRTGGARFGPYDPGLTAAEMGVAEVVDAVELEPRRPDLEKSNAATVGRAVEGRCLSCLCMLLLVLKTDSDLGMGRRRFFSEGRFFSEWVDRCEEVACME